MLYYLYDLYHINLFQYITVRAGFAFFIALLLTLFVMPRFICWAKRACVQPISDYAPQNHQEKEKTPTMGGMVFIVSTIIASLLSIKLSSYYAFGAILTLFLFAIIGFKDDYFKIVAKQNSGISAKVKLLLQILFSLMIGYYLYYFAGMNCELYVPFFKTPVMDMHYLALPFWALVIVASSNAVNLTDGLDGLATVPSIFSLATLGIITYIVGNIKLSSYLLLPNFAVGEVVIVASALIGALIGFLWYNCHPAEIFMGDSGSLPLGAFIAYMGIIAKSEILLLLIGLIFVVETISVILQIGSYRLRQKKVFLMAPIHHHFEMKQWAENKIIVRFWIISILSNLLALITLKIR